MTKLLTQMWLAVEGDDWQAQFERALCVKIFRGQGELEGWDVVHREAKDLFFYQSRLPFGDYVDSQENSIRTLFRNYNTGEGKDSRSNPAGDMCSGVKAIFGDGASDAVYSVIHSRSLEGEPGVNLLGKVSRRSGCDPRAALWMRPDYVKSILEPLGMTKYPIVVITDGQDPKVLERLRDDPDRGDGGRPGDRPVGAGRSGGDGAPDAAGLPDGGGEFDPANSCMGS